MNNFTATLDFDLGTGDRHRAALLVTGILNALTRGAQGYPAIEALDGSITLISSDEKDDVIIVGFSLSNKLNVSVIH